MPTLQIADRTAGAGRLATGLGVFSLGLGTAQLVAPGAVNRLIGIRDDAKARRLQRFVGMQELGAAAGLLSGTKPAAFLWGRSAGDVLHLTMLARAFGRAQDQTRLTGAIAAVAGVFGADLYASASAA